MLEADRIADTLALDEPVGRVRMVSPGRAKALDAMGIRTVRDLVMHVPRRHLDLTNVQTAASCPLGQLCTVVGVVHKAQLKRPRPRLALVEVTLVDATGTLMVTMFQQPWLMDKLEQGMRIAVSGKVEFNYGFKRMTNPFLEVLEPDRDAQGRVVAIHPATEKLSATMVRRLVGNALEACAGLLDPLPAALRTRYRLMSRGTALRCLHFAHDMGEVREAKRRLAYEEVLLLELALMTEGLKRTAGRRPCAHVVDGPALRALDAAVPFTLTAEQQKAREEILSRLAAPDAANHLLLGDVGTGKTVVAAYALAAAADTGGQAMLMAPTEVLARQHGKTLGPLLDAANVSWAVLTGSTPAAERDAICAGLADGSLSVLVGTHALLEDDVAPKRLTLAVIDEQQRFGVDQRARLLDKGEAPDALYLTATPIPRSLALAVYGNLTLSYLKARPNRDAVRTTHLHRKSDRGHAYDAAKEALKRGEQVYVVCPLIEEAPDKKEAKRSGGLQDDDAYAFDRVVIESDEDFAGADVSAATKQAAYLQSTVFADWDVALLHGRMKPAEKQEVMDRFMRNESQVLVATTVIEVGVDVPNATVMIVEDADRFGLSQLHQLRGRVGRGELDAQVHLVAATKDAEALKRLSALERTDDGFELAEFDLSLRREGDILGNRQHGASALKLVNIVRDRNVIEAAHRDAEDLLAHDPTLDRPEHRALAREMRLLFSSAADIQGG